MVDFSGVTAQLKQLTETIRAIQDKGVTHHHEIGDSVRTSGMWALAAIAAIVLLFGGRRNAK